MIPVRKQIYLTTELNRTLRSVARARGRSEAEIIREALERHLGLEKPSSGDPLEALYGAFEGPAPLDAREIDAIVYRLEDPCPACSSSTPPRGTPPSTAKTRRHFTVLGFNRLPAG